jgi:AraC-like DNA-binding protein
MSYDHRLLSDKVFSYLQRKPCSSLGDISRELHISPRTIQKVACTTAGKKFSELRAEILVAKVKELFVLQPQLAIKEVSFAVGYRSARSFSRAVKRACGFSPEEFRSRVTQELVIAQDTHVAIPDHF